MIAPVSVARSTTTSGPKVSCAHQIASHSTSRPSASVLITSTVWPFMVVTTSPGRWALPSGIFSTRPTTPTTCALDLRAAIACIAPVTAPAPPMSHFMSSMPAGGFRLMPPVSKVTPLPTRHTGFTSSRPVPFQRMARMRAGRTEPCATPSSAPMPCFFMSASSRMVSSTPSAARSRALSTKLSGYSTFGGNVTSVRVRATPPAIAISRSCAVTSPAPTMARLVSVGFCLSFCVVRY